MIDTVSCAVYRQMMLCAAASLEQQKQLINDLNVFPVPDGDTGTNMSLTMKAAMMELQKKNHDSVSAVADTMSSALLRGARGNSGVILSLIFRGFSKALKGKEDINGADLAAALAEGVNSAYKAVMKPAEGTILTVSRIAAYCAAETAENDSSFETVLEAAISGAKKALAETIEQNPTLKKAGVIDAGGKGFVIILEGMEYGLHGGTVDDAVWQETADSKNKATFSDFETEDITFPYCTEFIITKFSTASCENELRIFLNNLGDSLVVVEDDDIVKVHVHTDHPGNALEKALEYGSLLTVKIENMKEQHSAVVIDEEDGSTESKPALAPNENPFGFVAVCAGSGIADLFIDLGADRIVNGGQTMNPSTEDIMREIVQVPAETVFVLPNNKNITMAAQQCVPILKEKNIVVIPTCSVPEGISAILAYEPMATTEENIEAMTAAIDYVKSAQITYAARDSDIDGHTIKSGDYMAFAEGALIASKPDISAVLSDLADHIAGYERELITIIYGEDISEEEAETAFAIFSQKCPDAEISVLPGGQPVYYYIISAE